jgi:hypothetical protein
MSEEELGLQLGGLYQAVNPHGDWEGPKELAVVDDLEGEQETLPDSSDMSHLQETLLQASKGVTEGTDSEYQR